MSDDYQETIREPMRELAGKGGDLREDVRRIVTDALLERHLDPKAIREVMRATVEGLGEGLSGHAETAGGSLRTAMTGLDEALVRKLSAPVGLDIGAETPAEIAVSIAAELVRVRRRAQREPIPLSEHPLKARGGDGTASPPLWGSLE